MDMCALPCLSVHVQVSLCVYMSVHVCTLGIVHKEQYYNVVYSMHAYVNHLIILYESLHASVVLVY